MIDSDKPPEGRVLMRDGKWLVPARERPKNWRQIEQPQHYEEKPRDVAVMQQRRTRRSL